MFRFGIDGFEICCQEGELPENVETLRQKAKLSEHFDEASVCPSSLCFVSVGRSQDWPSLVATQRYSPAQFGFHPGALFVPETGTLFIGAGIRLLAYDVERRVRLWEDRTDCGFWSWSRHDSVILLAAELELAAFDLRARKLWTRFVEPPWSFETDGDFVVVDVMGTKSRIELLTGKPALV